MTQPPPPDADAGARRFRQTLVRVMAVQVAALVALWLIQQHFSG
jgi:hypothetical protein